MSIEADWWHATSQIPSDGLDAERKATADEMAAIAEELGLLALEGVVVRYRITHLAAALGLRGLALWGDTNQAVWHPRSPTFHVLRNAEGLARLSPETVFPVLRKILHAHQSD